VLTILREASILGMTSRGNIRLVRNDDRTDNKRILRSRSSGVPICDQLLSGRWASARRKSASRYAARMVN
jgi:hypothetical protein